MGCAAVKMAHEFVCKGTMLPAEIARFAARVRGLGGEPVIQGTGIMIAGFPAGDGLMQLRTEMEQAGGSMMVLNSPRSRNSIAGALCRIAFLSCARLRTALILRALSIRAAFWDGFKGRGQHPTQANYGLEWATPEN